MIFIFTSDETIHFFFFRKRKKKKKEKKVPFNIAKQRIEKMKRDELPMIVNYPNQKISLGIKESIFFDW